MKVTFRRETLAGPAPFKLLHLSDLHLRWTGRALPHIEALLSQVTPDAVALTGDYYDTPRGAALFLGFLSRLASRYPVYWTAGNHDRWFPGPHLRLLRQVPHCHCVDDQKFTHQTASGHHFEFVSWAEHVQRPAPGHVHRIVLLHNPERIRTSQLPGCRLLLAGHLHGAQFVFWQGRDGRYFPGRLLYRWCGPRFQVGQSTVIVSRGLGDTLPFRFRCPKEAVLVEFQPGGVKPG